MIRVNFGMAVIITSTVRINNNILCHSIHLAKKMFLFLFVNKKFIESELV